MGGLTLAVLLAAALWDGRRVVLGMAVLLAFLVPWLGLVAAAGWGALAWMRRDRGPSPDDEARFLGLIASELNSGASPRSALVMAGRQQDAVEPGYLSRLAASGQSGLQISHALREALPLNGRLAGAAWALASEAGAPAAPVIAHLQMRAAERGRLQRERRALTAQARATAWLIAGLPPTLFVFLVITGRVSSGPSVPVALIGLALQAAGMVVVALMLRRAAA